MIFVSSKYRIILCSYVTDNTTYLHFVMILTFKLQLIFIQKIVSPIVLIFLGNFCLNSVNGRTCILDKQDTFFRPCGYCGVCKTTLKSQNLGVCDYQYLERSGLFLDSHLSSQCTLKNYCENHKNLCKNDSIRFTGDCIPLFGTFLCGCKQGYFGKNCENTQNPLYFELKQNTRNCYETSSNPLAVVHNVVFTPIFYSVHFATILVSLQSTGCNVRVYIDNGREKLQYNEQKCERKFTIRKFCNDLFSEVENIRLCEGKYLQNLKLPRNKRCLMTFKMPFPRSYNKSKVIYQYNDEVRSANNPVQGNLETISIQIKNDVGEFINEQVFDYTFKIINIHKTFDLRIHFCVPKVRLVNCGTTMENMPYISRYTDLVILRSVDTNQPDFACQENDKFTSFWNVWRIQENHDELKDKPLLKTLDSKSYVPNEKEMDYGVYKVRLTVIPNFANQIVPEKAYCYFKLIRTPIQTTILGGSMRKIYYNKPITFDISSSVIPERFNLGEGMKVLYYWRCNDLQEQFCKPFVTSDTTRKIRGPFKDLNTYNFTVDTAVTQKFGVVMEHPETQVIKVTPSSVLNLGIICLKNCGGSVFKSNPQEIILLQVSSRQPLNENVQLYWKYKCLEDDIDFQDVGEIKDGETLQPNLLVQRNKLKEGSKYIFLVAAVDSESSAEIMVETDESPSGIVCEVFPNNGTKGETMFSVSCKSHEKEDGFPSLTYRYEFYDRYETEKIGRMVGYSTTGVIAKIMLTRDKLFVRATNFFGTATEILVKIKLRSPVKKFSPSLIKSNNELKNKDYIYQMGLISAYSDLLGSRLSFWSDEMQILLNHLTKEEVQPEDIMGALLLKNALFITACDKFIAIVSETSIFHCESILSIAKILYGVAHRLEKSLSRNNTNWRMFTTTRTTVFVDSILECLNFVLKAIFLTVQNSRDFGVHECLKKSTYYTIDTLDYLVYIVALQMPLIKKQKFEAKNISLFIGESGPHFGDSVMQALPEFKNMQFLEVYKYYIQQVIFNRNPFWWGSGSKINTNVYSFQLNSGNKHIKNPNIGRIVHFNLKVNDEFSSTLVQGSVKQPDPKQKSQVNDFEVVVYRIDPETYSETIIEFVNFIDKAKIKVLVLQGERPDFDLMTTKATEVTQFSKKWSFGLKGKKNTTFYYLGILPGPQVNIGVSVNYSFTLFSARCAVWKYRSWISGEKCAVNKTTNMKHSLLVCSCTLLTLTIGGYVYNPIISLNPFSDLSLFLKIPENILTVSIVLIALIFYSALLIWTKKKDKEDKKRKNVLVLEDGCMNGSYKYLIAVFTGSRFWAGTTSSVGIKLFGETANSRTFVFSSSHQRILQCGGDDWFLLSTTQHLGSLLKIKLWIDYSGLFPNWFCRKVTIFDLKNSETSNFLVEKWFGINMNGVCIEAVTKCAASHEVDTFRLIFFHNLIQGLREFHIYISIFFKHPRSIVTRTQRLTVSLCCVLVAMVTTTLLYSLSTPVLEDFPVYDIRSKTFVISFISSLSAIIVGLITMRYFQKSYTIVGRKFSKQSDTKINITNIHERDNKNKYNCLKLLSKCTEKYVSSCKVIPIGNVDNTMGLEENKSTRNLAWMICFSIIFVSVYIILMSSLTFGETKRLIWLTSLIFTGLIGFFILVPTKVFLTAIFLSLLKIRYFDLMLHNLKDEYLEYITKDKCMEVNEKNKKVHGFFFHSHISWHDRCYGKVMKSHYRTIRIWSFSYILEALILIGVIMLVMEEFDTYKNFYANTAVCNEMMTVQMCDRVFDIDISYFLLRFHVLENMLPKLYRIKWYNGDALTSREEWYHETGWMRDANARLIGDPHFLQVRVKRGLCKVPTVMLNLTRTCLPSLSPSTVDRDNYSLSWTHDDWTEIELFVESPWEFVQGSGIGVRTPSDYYLREGAYVATLLRTLVAAKQIYTNLMDTNWIDDQSRVIVLEFITYNVNNNIITSSYFITETYSTNTIKVSHTIRSIKHYFHNISFQGKIFCILCLYFAVRTLVLTNIMGVGNVLKNFWNWYDVFFSILYIVAAVKYIYLLYLLGKDEEKAEVMVKNRHVYLEVVFQAQQDAIIYICYTFGVAAIRLIRIAGINDSCKKYMNDFVQTRTELALTVLLSFSSMFIMFRLIMYYIEPPTVYDFMDILVFQSDFHSLEEQYDTVTGKLSAYALGRLSDITMFSFTISLLHHQRQISIRRISLIKTQ